MIRPETTANLGHANDHAPLDRVLEEIVKNDQWIDDFMKRLTYAIDDIVRSKP